MTTKTYGQYCGVGRALELVGERWALLIVRDLLVGPKRYTDLRAGLPKIPTNVLATRLKELESAGLVERRILPRPSGAIVYELTRYGADLEEVVLALGRWGARSLGELRPDEIITPDILVMALRSTFQPGKLKAKYELRFGDIVIHALIDGDNLTVDPGPLKGAVVLTAYAPIAPLLAGTISAKQAIDTGLIKTSGTPKNLTHFATAFPITPPV